MDRLGYEQLASPRENQCRGLGRKVVGILLTVGIIYMIYQQLERENLYEAYPMLGKFVK